MTLAWATGSVLSGRKVFGIEAIRAWAFVGDFR